MNETVRDGAAARDSHAAHVDELVAAGWTEYRLLALVEESVPEADRSALCAAVVAILDILRLEEVRPGAVLLDTARALLPGSAGGALRFQTWHGCLAAARPHRGTLQDVCRDFPQWLAGVTEVHYPAWCELLPVLLEAHKRAGIQLIPDLREEVNQVPTTMKAAAWFEFWHRYLPVTLSDNLPSLQGLSGLGCQPEAQLVVAGLAKVCSPEKVGEDEATQEFLATSGRAMKALPGVIRVPCMQLLLGIAESSLDSAVSVADRLPRTLAALDPAQQGAYLAIFTRLVRQVGIISIGFGLGALQARFAAGHAASARSFGESICEVAARYGVQAAVDFMERRTRASQACWVAAADKSRATSASA